MVKSWLICLVGFMVISCSLEERRYDCTRVNYDKMFEYITWCQEKTGYTIACTDKAKEMFCVDIINHALDSIIVAP